MYPSEGSVLLPEKSQGMGELLVQVKVTLSLLKFPLPRGVSALANMSFAYRSPKMNLNCHEETGYLVRNIHLMIFLNFEACFAGTYLFTVQDFKYQFSIYLILVGWFFFLGQG